MVKRHQRAPRRSAPPPVGRGALLRLAVLIVTVALTAIGAVQLRNTWRRLPRPSVDRIDWDAVRNAQRSLSGPAGEGRILAIISTNFTICLHQTERLPDVLEDTRAGIRHLRQTDVGRLQLLALTLLHLERANVAPEQWWQRVRHYLDGLDNASFDHYLPELIDVETDVYTRQGIDDGVARRLAMTSYDGIHGPFLQHLDAKLRAIAQASRRSGDEEAALRCERIMERLLRQWIITRGPAGLRLLAAELLADRLEHDASTRPAAADLPAKLRAWRRTFREHAAAAGLAPPLLRIGDTPPTPEQRQLGAQTSDAVALCVWASAALVPVAVLALLLAPLWIGGTITRTTALHPCIAAVLAGVVAIAVGHLAVAYAPDSIHDDALRALDDDLGQPRMPLVAAAGGLGITLIAAAVALRRPGPMKQRWAAWGTALVAVWSALALYLVLFSIWTAVIGSKYDQALLTTPEDALVTLADPRHDGLLDELRAWHP